MNYINTQTISKPRAFKCTAVYVFTGICIDVQGGSNMIPVIFEPPCIIYSAAMPNYTQFIHLYVNCKSGKHKVNINRK